MIFAVTAEQISVYEQLSKHIEGSSTGVLSNDSDNIVDLVREQYNVSSLECCGKHNYLPVSKEYSL